ncbi:MAG: hypothetical protein ACK4ND_06925 [Cytophagaceae bacterium]
MYLVRLLKHITPRPLLVLIQCFVLLPYCTCAADFRVDDYHIKNNNGHIKLQWDATDHAIVEVQKSQTPNFSDFSIVYKGIDRASFISGLDNGLHYFRVREVDSGWSPTLTLEVKHQSLKLAFILFSMGALVFLLTVFVVVKGAKQAGKENG